MDPLTERMENLWWARILVKTKGGELPSSLEIRVDGISYNLPLWWEVLSSIRQKSEGYRGLTDRAEKRLGATEAHVLTREWKSRVTQGSRRCHEQLTGRKGRSDSIRVNNPILSGWGGSWVIFDWAHRGHFGLEPFGPSVTNSHGPTEFQLNKGLLGKSLAQPKSYGEVNIELEFLSMRKKEVGREQQADFHYSLTNSALAKEVSRKAYHIGIVLNCQDAVGPSANGNDYWELVEFNGPISVARDLEGGSSQYESQEGRGEGALNWEESSLAKFSQFFGFSTVGLKRKF
ncbi:hypothetical protein CK203_069837 [Vitis vinifera]|uniref:Uncharacterized protein n=1 Tax=Vitis vinifera TaxID=29760 RepID=A0A438DZT4_VITVI|nr:hypothetical protein CK203_069837 [Vitis vinifera]